MKRKFSSVLIILLLFISSVLVYCDSVEIIVLHSNDTHSRVEAGEGMGFARLAGLVNKYRSEEENVLVLDAGDTFHGQVIANLARGESIARILNLIRYDALVPGNHDFNYGQERLLELDKITDFPIISANVKKEGRRLFTPYIIKELSGVRVGIFGLSTPETAYKTHPDNVRGLVFEDPVESAREMVEELKDKTDLIIALTHLGISGDSQYTSKMLAEKVKGIDLIVDGHSHDALPAGLLVDDTLIVMAGEYDKNLGIVRITFEDGRVIDKKAELIDQEKAGEFPEGQEVLQLIEEIKEKNAQELSVVLGETEVFLDGERGQVRTQETNLGNLITDAILVDVEADCVMINGGGIRSSIEKGEIQKGDIISVLPFGNYVVVKEMSGELLLEALEHGVSAYPDTAGIFPQVAGMSFVFEPAASAGERIVEVKVGGTALDPEKLYKVATNDFMAAGGDEYTMFAESPVIQEAGSMEEIVINYISSRGKVKPKVEGRILMLEKKGDHYYYTVKSGDVLSVIAYNFKLDMEEIAELNDIEDLDSIYPGQELLIPVE